MIEPQDVSSHHLERLPPRDPAIEEKCRKAREKAGERRQSPVYFRRYCEALLATLLKEIHEQRLGGIMKPVQKTPVDTLSDQWRERAGLLRQYAAEPQAMTLEAAATELAAAWEEWQGQLLSLSEAAKESGYTQGNLRRLVDDGVIPNGGTEGIRVRRGDLPRKPGHGVKTSARTTIPDEEIAPEPPFHQGLTKKEIAQRIARREPEK